MEKYSFEKIEKKWSAKWEDSLIHETKKDLGDKKFYCLVEFPYPSGKGLHVGHPRSYTAMDIIARKRRMEGYNVLFPIGWDAFGLPAENYAIKTGTHPKITTQENIDNFRRQLKSIGFSFDWSREINTTDPNYYKWTQWIFLKLFENGLAYKKTTNINWCTSCNVGLANEEVVSGRCERCGGDVIQKEKEQWMLKITEYADRLIKDLDLVDYPSRVKKQQIDWIGKSEGASISFKIEGFEEKIDVFTTRPDTIFGATFLVISPEHPFVEKITEKEYLKDVVKYQENAKNKSDFERGELQKDKTGVFTGAYAVNPATKKNIPIWISDYVLMSYGTGAIMSVPAHDQRDFDFAKKYGIEIKEVVHPMMQSHTIKKGGRVENIMSRIKEHKGIELPYVGDGILINSEKFNNMRASSAIDKIIVFIGAEKRIQYKLRDWVFSRQRYWGEPIPLVYCSSCAEKIKNGKFDKELSKGEKLNPGWFSVDENSLPVTLPEIKEYRTTENGNSPLALISEWTGMVCPKCGGKAERETDTMPQWAGSSWYYLRYIDPNNNKELASKDLMKHWLPVDWYNGGMEHTTLHLLYSRFWHKFLYDIGIVPTVEPYVKRTSHGLILGKGGEKMSKSRGNVVSPDDMVKEFGADVFRLYEMFMGPFEDAIPWNNDGMLGGERFLNRVWNMRERVKLIDPDINILKISNRTIKKVSEDVENMKFNTAISALMIMVNYMEKLNEIPKSIFEKFILMLSLFSPFVSEELWEKIGNVELIEKVEWPTYDKKYLEDNDIVIAVQINGKTRGTITIKKDSIENSVVDRVYSDDKLFKYIEEKSNVKKIIFVQNRIINFLI